MKIKCHRCGEEFEDEIIETKELKGIDKELAPRTWCNSCIIKMWKEDKEDVEIADFGSEE